MNGFWGDVYEQGQSFLSYDKWEIKLLSEFFPIHIQHFMSESNSEIITHRVSTIHDWFWGDVYESGKVS